MNNLDRKQFQKVPQYVPRSLLITMLFDRRKFYATYDDL